MRIIDLSLPIDDTAFEPFPVTVERITHGEGAKRVGRKFVSKPSDPLAVRAKNALLYLLGKRRIDESSFPDGMFLSHESVAASVHCGTHMDAPWHFGPESQGAAAKKIADVPLEWCYGSGVVLDMTSLAPGSDVTPADIDRALGDIGHKPGPGDIVILKTGADKRFGGPGYFSNFPGLGKDGLDYILDMGVKVVGTDAPGLDRPFGQMVKDYYDGNDMTRLWPAHIHGRKREYCHIERLANLDNIPAPTGFTFACFPVKIKDAGAAWARAVAIIEE